MIDFDAYVKYSRPGPRYTSYPTAPEFSDKFNYEDYLRELKNRDASRPISLYLHLPFCRSACYFCGCNVIYTSKESAVSTVVTAAKAAPSPTFPRETAA